MADARADTLRALALELEQRDAVIAGQIDVLAALAERVTAVRARASEIAAALQSLPGEIAAVERAQVAARAIEDEARVELTGAEQRREQVERSRRATEEEKAAARRTAQDAVEALADAEHRGERLRAQRAELVDTQQALQVEAEGLAVTARAIAGELREAPRLADAATGEPGPSLADLDTWGGTARAALFVARGTLETERDRVVAEANALGSAVLGEELGGASVALVRRRVEEALS